MKPKTKKWAKIILAGLSIGLLSGCGEAKKEVLLKETLDHALVEASGTPIPAASVLNTDYLLLYFSAHWCPPCKAFTPKLVDFYQTHGGGQRFHVILVSGDRSEKAMFAYMRETRMPWSAVRFGSESAKTLQDIYSGSGIPRLVLLDPQNEVIADSFKGRNYLGPQHVIEELKKLLSTPEPQPQPTPAPSEPLNKRFKLTGFGESAGQRVAIINGELATVGAELDTGVRLEEIAVSYVVISFEGQHHRLNLSNILGK